MHTCAPQHPDITLACHAADTEDPDEIRLLEHAELYANKRQFALIEPLFSLLDDAQKSLCHDIEPITLADGSQREVYLATIDPISSAEPIAEHRMQAATEPAPEVSTSKGLFNFPWANRRTTILLSLLGVMMYGVQIKQVAILACDLGEHGAKAIETVQGGP